MNKPAFTRNNRGMILVHLVFWNKRKITITIIWGKNKPIIITVTIIWGKNKPIIITISNYDSFFLLLIAIMYLCPPLTLYQRGDNFSSNKLILGAHNIFSRRRIIFFSTNYFSKRTALFWVLITYYEHTIIFIKNTLLVLGIHEIV